MLSSALKQLVFSSMIAVALMPSEMQAQSLQPLERPLDALTELTGIDTGDQKLARVASFRRADPGRDEEYAIEDFGTDDQTWLRDYCPIDLQNLKSIEAVTLNNSTSLHGYVKPYMKKQEWRFVRFGFKTAVEVKQFDTHFDRGLMRTKEAVFCEIGYALRTDPGKIDALVSEAGTLLQGLSN